MRIVFLNTERLNYDNRFNLNDLAEDIKLYEHTDKSDLIERVNNKDIVIVKEMVLDYDTIMSFPSSVKMICEAGTGYNNISLEACKNKGITVCNCPSYASRSVAELTMGLIYSLNSRLNIHINEKEDIFINNGLEFSELSSKTLGIIGTGEIGLEVIRLAKNSFNRIIAYSRTIKSVEGVQYVSLDELLKQSDVISLHCPLTDDTKEIINKNNINLIKKNAIIINTARGALIDEKALIDALKNHEIFGAGLDSFVTEPLNINSELYKLDNVILTPHIGWRSIESREKLIKTVKENIYNFESGTPSNVVAK